MNAPKSPESSGSKQPRRNSRSQFLVIVFLTAIPLLIAWGLFQTSFVREYFGHTNKGQLITPPKAIPPYALLDLDGKRLPEGAFTHHWSLIYIGGEDCDKTCVKKTFMVHNIRWLLQQHYKQLRVFYLAPSEAAMKRAQQAMLGAHMLLKKAGDLPVMVTDAAKSSNVMMFFDQNPGSVVMVDPKGRWIMAYPPGFVVDNVYQDLRHLLRYSQL